MTTDPKTGMDIVDPDECWALVRDERVGRLAVSIADHPDIFPINHVVDHGSIVFRTEAGTKLAASVLGRAVAFEVDGWDLEAGDAWSVVVKGVAEELATTEELLAAEDLPLQPWSASPKPRFVRIVAHEVSGRRFQVVPVVLSRPH